LQTQPLHTPQTAAQTSANKRYDGQAKSKIGIDYTLQLLLLVMMMMIGGESNCTKQGISQH